MLGVEEGWLMKLGSRSDYLMESKRRGGQPRCVASSLSMVGIHALSNPA